MLIIQCKRETMMVNSAISISSINVYNPNRERKNEMTDSFIITTKRKKERNNRLHTTFPNPLWNRCLWDATRTTSQSVLLRTDWADWEEHVRHNLPPVWDEMDERRTWLLNIFVERKFKKQTNKPPPLIIIPTTIPTTKPTKITTIWHSKSNNWFIHIPFNFPKNNITFHTQSIASLFLSMSLRSAVAANTLPRYILPITHCVVWENMRKYVRRWEKKRKRRKEGRERKEDEKVKRGREKRYWE